MNMEVQRNLDRYEEYTPKVDAQVVNQLQFRNYLRLAFVMAAAFLFAFFVNMKTLHAANQVDSAYEEDAKNAASGVEQMFVHQMIQELRKSVPENELIPKSQSERIFEAMLDQEYSQILTETGNFGIKDQVLAEITGKR